MSGVANADGAGCVVAALSFLSGRGCGHVALADNAAFHELNEWERNGCVIDSNASGASGSTVAARLDDAEALWLSVVLSEAKDEVSLAGRRFIQRVKSDEPVAAVSANASIAVAAKVLTSVWRGAAARSRLAK